MDKARRANVPARDRGMLIAGTLRAAKARGRNFDPSA